MQALRSRARLPDRCVAVLHLLAALLTRLRKQNSGRALSLRHPVPVDWQSQRLDEHPPYAAGSCLCWLFQADSFDALNPDRTAGFQMFQRIFSKHVFSQRDARVIAAVAHTVTLNALLPDLSVVQLE